MRNTIRQMMLPLRKAAKCFVNPVTELNPPNYVASQDSIIYKVASFAAVNKVEGDYLEFGVFQGCILYLRIPHPSPLF